MIQLNYSPIWFNIPSIIIDFFSFLVLFLIGTTSIKYYRLNKQNRKYFYLALSFFIICASFLFKLLTNLTIYYRHVVQSANPETVVTIALEAVRSYNIFSLVTYEMFVFLNLVGLYFLYSLYQKKQSESSIFLIIYFIILTTYFSNLVYYLFHTTSFLLLVMIANLYRNKHLKTRYMDTKIVMYSFGIIAISQIFFLFLSLNKYFYVLAEITQLAGYSLLFLILQRVVQHGKKKK